MRALGPPTSKTSLIALVALTEQRNVERKLGIGLLPGLGVRVLPQHRALGVDAQPAAVRSLEDLSLIHI